MNTYIIIRNGGWATPQELKLAAARSLRVGLDQMADRIRWIRSYVTRDPNDRLGTVCVYQATDPDAVRDHARRSELPADEIIPVTDTVVINDDPTPVK